MDGFIAASQDVTVAYPETKAHIDHENQMLKSKWVDVLRIFDDLKRMIQAAMEYFALAENVSIMKTVFLKIVGI
jgi:hypothetical protein